MKSELRVAIAALAIGLLSASCSKDKEIGNLNTPDVKASKAIIVLKEGDTEIRRIELTDPDGVGSAFGVAQQGVLDTLISGRVYRAEITLQDAAGTDVTNTVKSRAADYQAYFTIPLLRDITQSIDTGRRRSLAGFQTSDISITLDTAERKELGNYAGLTQLLEPGVEDGVTPIRMSVRYQPGMKQFFTRPQGSPDAGQPVMEGLFFVYVKLNP